MCLAAMDAFELPLCLNLYVTARGTSTSAPPHTDKQDVFVLQSCGAKRWRVFEPPAPAAKPNADPLARGKAHDSLEMSELGEPLLDCVLSPGQVLYVPAGFPHTTDTVNTAEAGEAAGEDSVHLTIGIDTHIWGMNYASLRAGALGRASLPDGLNVQTLPKDKYWQVMGIPRSLGFLRRHGAGGEHATADVAAELVRVMRLAEPKRWDAEVSDEEVARELGAEEIAQQLEQHRQRIYDVQRAMYLDAALDRLPAGPPGAPRVSLFRVQEHMAKLEAAMEDHVNWYGKEAAARAVAAAKASAGPTAATKPKKAGSKVTTAAVGGFGGGGGAKGGGKGKKKKKR